MGISVLFSFGFTIDQSNCEFQKIEEVFNGSNDGCCNFKVEKKSKECKADCCLIQSNFFVLNDFTFTTKSLEKIKIFETIKHINFVYYLDNYSLKNYADKIDNYHYLDSRYSGRQIISLKQSWLI